VAIVMVFSGRAFWISRAAGTLARRLGKKVVLWLHGGDLPRYTSTRARAITWLANTGDVVVAPSSYLLGIVAAASGDRRTIPNLLPDEDITFRHRQSARPKILWMRTFHPMYQPLLALETLQILVRSGVNASLTYAGQDRGMLAAIQLAIEKLGLQGRVEVAGFLSPERKKQALLNHDIYLNTTAVDNYPVSLVEAAAAGMAIVTTPAGGISDLFVHGRNALIVESSDPVLLANGVRRLVGEPALVRHISGEARELARRCTWERVGPSWTSLLNKMIRPATDDLESHSGAQ
jgi:glycosyltransferase involved in cell wall biosynthesis